MVLAMASQDAQNFFQPLSSWMSRVYEALQQAGDALSASLVNLSRQDSKLSDKLDQDLDDMQMQETYFENEEQSNDWSQEDTNSLFLEVDHFSCCNSDLQDSTQSSSPRLSQHAKDSCSIMSQWPNQTLDDQKLPHVLSSIAEEDHHLEKQRSGLQRGFESQLSGILENVNGKKQASLALSVPSIYGPQPHRPLTLPTWDASLFKHAESLPNLAKIPGGHQKPLRTTLDISN